MAVIAVTDVQVELLPTADPAGAQPADQVMILGKMKMSRVRFTISATKALSYPSSGGIPLPTWKAAGNGDTSFGMVRNVSHVEFYQMGVASHPSQAANRTDVVWKYDSENHVIRGFWETHATSTANASATGFVELPTTWFPSFGAPSGVDSPGLRFYAKVYGW